jgi:undecaprenyl-diphosphatase
MNFIQAIVLGVVQGLTEFLPVSSSAHLSIVSRLMNGQDAGAAFSAIIQIGTEAAIIVYFFKDIVRILYSWGKEMPKLFHERKLNALSQDARMGWMIILGTIPIVIIGVLLKDYIEGTFRSLWITAGMLILFGIIIWACDEFGKINQGLGDLGVKSSLWFGLAQCFALVPGVSRSGSTIAAGRFLGFDRESAAKFSFYLAIPSVFGAGLFELKDVLEDFNTAAASGWPGWTATIVATVVSFVVGYVVIAAFMKMISKISFKPFAYYRVIVGIITFILLACCVIPA